MISHESLQSCYSWYNFYPNNLAVILEVYLWTVFYGLCLTMEANFYTPDLLAYINLAWLSILIYLVYDLVKGEGAPLHVPWINNAILKEKSLLIVYRCFLGINPEQGSKKAWRHKSKCEHTPKKACGLWVVFVRKCEIVVCILILVYIVYFLKF